MTVLRILTVFLLPCLVIAAPFDLYQKGVIKGPKGDSISIILSLSEKEKSQGLSGTKEAQFKDSEGMLFAYNVDGEKAFWMPDTYFDLDLFYLDKDLVILKIDRQVTHHPGYQEPPAIKRLPAYFCRHVLEMKSSSPIAKNLRPGDKLNWSSTPELWQILQKMRN